MRINFTPIVRSLFLFTVLSIPAIAVPFGVAADYYAFILGNMEQEKGSIKGRVAVGGDALLSNLHIGSDLAVDPLRDDLIVGGNLTYEHGHIFKGSGIYRGTGTLSDVVVPHGSLTQGDSLIDFAAAAAYLMAESDSYAALGGISGVLTNHKLALTGADTDLNVFYLSAGTLATLDGLSISAPSGSTVLINVAGAVNSFISTNMTVIGTKQDKVLFNFFQTTLLSSFGTGIKGSILAPEAAISFDSGHVNGQVIAASLTGDSQAINGLFTGSLPLPGNLVSGDVPEPATWCFVGGALMLLGIRRRRS